ncbi:MAG: SurA N-terminal domain-containing protein [Gammaproteobacteria bacterium]|nr:SurA N-terminal domain-containing protein [Gammaproteobacteria bacterium]
MLQSFSDGIKNSKWLAYGIIGLIIIPFAFFGISSYLSGDGSSYVALVNGAEISSQALDREYAEQKNRLQKAFGGKLPAGMGDGGFLKKQALEALINRELLRQAADEEGYRIGDDLLAKQIRSEKVFQKEGRFDSTTYEAQLRSIGYSSAQFEASVRRAAALDQIRQGLVDSAFVLPSEQEQIELLKQQQREVASIALPLANYRQEAMVSAAEIEEYFKNNQARYQYPEKLKLEYLELDAEVLLPEVEIEPEELQALYAERKASLTNTEERVAAHILLKLSADASDEQIEKRQQEMLDIKRRLADGEGFAELAKVLSEDPGSAKQGGDLGSVAKGMMVKPFEEALFALQAGEISEPVQSQFGLHLIQLKEIKAKTIKPFAEVSAELEVELRHKKVEESLFYDRSELLGNESYENVDSLSPAAEATGLKVQVSDWIERGSVKGVAQYPQVRQAAFSEEVLQEGRNSAVLELADNHQLVIRLKEHQSARVKPLAEVSDEIKTVLLDRKARLAQQEAANTLLTALKAGDSVQALVDAAKLNYNEATWVGRNETAQEPALLKQLFKMAKPAAGKRNFDLVRLPSGDQAVLILSGVKVANKKADGDKSKTAPANSDRLAQSRGLAEYSAWLEVLKSKAEIVRRADL